MNTQGRWEYDDCGNNGDGERVFIPEEVCDAIDRLSVYCARSDYAAARIILAELHSKWIADAERNGRNGLKKELDDQNRMDANYGHGKVCFRTKDGLECEQKLSDKIEYGGRDWPREIRRAERNEVGCIINPMDLNASTPIAIRRYLRRPEMTKRGLWVYEEQ